MNIRQGENWHSLLNWYKNFHHSNLQLGYLFQWRSFGPNKQGLTTMYFYASSESSFLDRLVQL